MASVQENAEWRVGDDPVVSTRPAPVVREKIVDRVGVSVPLIDIGGEHAPEILAKHFSHMPLAAGGLPDVLELAVAFPAGMAQHALHQGARGPWRGRGIVEVAGRMDPPGHVSGWRVRI